MITAAIFGALAGAMLIYPREAAEAAIRALSLWAKSVAPVLGPFMISMQMISSRIGGGPLPRLIMGWLCGSPGGARLMGALQPGRKSALRYAAFTGTMSPMFFLGAVSAWLGDGQSALIILFCHVGGAILTGLMLPGDRSGKMLEVNPAPLPAALRDCANALLVIALCMMLGSVTAKMAACALPRLPSWAGILIQCGLEVTGGVQGLIALSPPLLDPMVCAACSFGGLSILLQNTAFWQPAGIKLYQLFLLRCVHGGVSFLLCLTAGKLL